MIEHSGGWGYCLIFFFMCIAIWQWSAKVPFSLRLLVRMFLIGWICSSLTLLLELIVYDEILSIESYLYLSGFVMMFIAGLVSSQYGGITESCVTRNPDEINPLAIYFLLTLSVGYMFYEGIDVLIKAPRLLNGFNLLRAEHWDMFVKSRSIGILDSIAAGFRASAFIFCCLIFGGLNQKRMYKFIASFLLVIIVLEILLNAGRSILFFLVITIVYMRVFYNKNPRIMDFATTYYKRSKKYRVKKYVYVLTGLCGLYFMMVIFPTLRNVDEYTNYDLYLSFRHNSNLSDWVIKVDKILPGVATLAFSSDYLSLPMVKMNDFIKNIGVGDWYSMGAYSFSVPAKIYTLLSGENVHHNVRMALEGAVSDQGYLSIRPWSTAAGDFAVDFGLLGGCATSFFVAWILGRLYFNGQKSCTPEGRVLCGLIALCIIIFPFKSPLNITIIANSIVLSAIIFIMPMRSIAVGTRR